MGRRILGLGEPNSAPSSNVNATATKPFAEVVTSAAPAIAFVLATAYVCGFIIVNTYLARFGVFESDFLKPRYLAAGGVFFVAHALLWFLVLAKFKDLNYARDWLLEFGSSDQVSDKYWKTYALLLPIVEMYCGLAMTLVFCDIFLAQTPSYMSGFITGGYVLAMTGYFVMMNSAAVRYVTRASLLWVFVFQLLIVLVAILYSTELMRDLFIVLFAAFLGGAFLLSYLRKRLDRTLIIYATSVYALAGSALFGTYVYDKVKVALGGGVEQTVSLLMKDESIQSQLSRATGIVDWRLREVRLLSENPTSIVVGFPAKANPKDMTVVRIDRSAVAAIVSRSP